MTILSWNDQYLIGARLIDDEHKALFALINQFHSHWTERRDAKQIATVLNKLIQYSERHFTDEEAIMEKEEYPKLAQHRQEHEKLIGTIFKLHEEFVGRHELVSHDIQKFCKHWLVDHIIYSDYAFRDFLAGKRAAQ